MKNIAIVLAGGTGNRMGADRPKQYLELRDKPVLYYSLNAFEHNRHIDQIILVTRREDIEYCREEIVKRFQLKKVTAVISGGAERYLSVYEGLKACDGLEDNDAVFVHDGARPFVDDEMIERLCRDVQDYGSAVAAVPSKDTVKLADTNGFVVSTPDRRTVWNIQTPQVFYYKELRNAYCSMLSGSAEPTVTDDAMVMESYSDRQVHLTMGSYRNLKITTPEDMLYCQAIIASKKL